MAIDWKKTVGALLVILLVSGIVYIAFGQEVKIRIDNDKSTIYIFEDSRWRVGGREYSRLFDGTSRMNRRLSDIKIYTSYTNNSVTIIRYTKYIRGPVINETWYFEGNITSKELFPIYHKVEIYNGSGFFYRYEVRDLDYDGETRKLDVNYMGFGKNISVEWESGYRWAWVYKTGILKVQYDIPSDYEVYNVKLFDPPPFDPPPVDTEKLGLSVASVKSWGKAIIETEDPFDIDFNLSSMKIDIGQKSLTIDGRFRVPANTLGNLTIPAGDKYLGFSFNATLSDGDIWYRDYGSQDAFVHLGPADFEYKASTHGYDHVYYTTFPNIPPGTDKEFRLKFYFAERPKSFITYFGTGSTIIQVAEGSGSIEISNAYYNLTWDTDGCTIVSFKDIATDWEWIKQDGGVNKINLNCNDTAPLFGEDSTDHTTAITEQSNVHARLKCGSSSDWVYVDCYADFPYCFLNYSITEVCYAVHYISDAQDAYMLGANYTEMEDDSGAGVYNQVDMGFMSANLTTVNRSLTWLFDKGSDGVQDLRLDDSDGWDSLYLGIESDTAKTLNIKFNWWYGLAAYSNGNKESMNDSIMYIESTMDITNTVGSCEEQSNGTHIFDCITNNENTLTTQIKQNNTNITDAYIKVRFYANNTNGEFWIYNSSTGTPTVGDFYVLINDTGTFDSTGGPITYTDADNYTDLYIASNSIDGAVMMMSFDSDIYLTVRNSTLGVANTTPVVSLYNLTDLSTEDTTPGIDFNYTDDDLTAKCYLLLNGTAYAINANTANATRTTLTANESLAPDDYAVTVSCWDGVNTGTSSSIIASISAILALQINGTAGNQIYELGTIAYITLTGTGTVCLKFNGSIDEVCEVGSASFNSNIYPHLDRPSGNLTSMNISNNGENITFDLTNRSEMLNATINITGYAAPEIVATEDDTEDAHAFTGTCYPLYPCVNAYDETWDASHMAWPQTEVIVYENYTVPTHDSADFILNHGKSGGIPVWGYNITTYYWDNADNSWKILKTFDTPGADITWTDFSTDTVAIPSNATNGTVLQFHTNFTRDSVSSLMVEDKVIWYYNNPTTYPKDLEIDINNDNTTDYIVWGEINGTSAIVNEFTNGETEENLTYESGGIYIRYIKVPKNISNITEFQKFTFNISGFKYISETEIGQSLTVNDTNSPYTLYGNYTFDNFWIQSNGIVALAAYNGTDDTGTLKLDIRTNFTIESGGYIDANRTGYGGGRGSCASDIPGVWCYGGENLASEGGNGTGAGTDAVFHPWGGAGAGGGSYGGIGGRGGRGAASTEYGIGGYTYDTNSSRDIRMGSGSGGGAGGGTPYSPGGTGQAGGGSVWIESPNIEIYGNIYAKGGAGGGGSCGCYMSKCEPCGGGGGGASGGGILLIAVDINISGGLSATGGAGGIVVAPPLFVENGKQGGGGRIKLFYNTLENTGTFDVSGYQSGSVYLIQEATNFPTNVTVDLGLDGINEWEMNDTVLNSTESPITVEIDMHDEVVFYIDSNCDDFETYCLIPIQIATETPGIILVDDINLTYMFNPITINASKFNLTGNTVDINFTGEQIGLTEISGINFTYNGRYTYNVTGYNSTNWFEYTLDIYWSNHSKHLPYTWTDMVIFNIFNETDNITPWGQDGDTPIYNVTYLQNHTANLSFAFNESQPACLDFYLSLDNTTWFNYTGKWWYSNFTTENQNIGIWMKLNVTNCSQRLYFPRAYFEGYCHDCLGGQ